LLTGKAAEIEKTISVKQHERKRYFDPTTFYENCFWNRRLDVRVINKNHQTECIEDACQPTDIVNLPTVKRDPGKRHSFVSALLRKNRLST